MRCQSVNDPEGFRNKPLVSECLQIGDLSLRWVADHPGALLNLHADGELMPERNMEVAASMFESKRRADSHSALEDEWPLTSSWPIN